MKLPTPILEKNLCTLGLDRAIQRALGNGKPEWLGRECSLAFDRCQCRAEVDIRGSNRYNMSKQS